MLKIATVITIAGFVLGGLAFAAVVMGASRSTAIHWFALGFVLAAIGITSRFLFAPTEEFDTPSPLGIKLSALGFGVAAVPTAIGGFFLGKTDQELAVFFWSGGALVIIGLLIHAWTIIGKKSG